MTAGLHPGGDRGADSDARPAAPEHPQPMFRSTERQHEAAHERDPDEDPCGSNVCRTRWRSIGIRQMSSVATYSTMKPSNTSRVVAGVEDERFNPLRLPGAPDAPRRSRRSPARRDLRASLSVHDRGGASRDAATRQPKAESRTKREEGPGGGLLRWESREGSGTSPGTARASSCPKRDRVTSAFRATAVRPIRFPRLLFALIPRDHRIHEADRDPTVTYVRPRRPRIP